MIYVADKKVGKLHKGDELIAKVYKGNDLIYRDVEALYSFKFTIDTTLDSGGAHTSTAKNMSISSTASYAGHKTPLLIDWGDGNQEVFQTSRNSIYHTYDTSGIYQIAILPTEFVNGEPVPGWLCPVNFVDHGYKIISIDKRVPENGLIVSSDETPASGMIRRNFSLFSGLRNITSVPDGWLDNIQFIMNGTSAASLFASAFQYFGERSNYPLDPVLPNLLDSLDFSSIENFSGTFSGTFKSSTISPAKAKRFFSTVDTSSGTNFSSMFSGTFQNENGYGRGMGEIPEGLFDFLDTSNGTNFSYMFSNTFSYACKGVTNATIPVGLFSHVNTSNGTNFSGMFSSTFFGCAQASTVATIPDGLFSHLNTSNGTNFNGMFYNCFRIAFTNSTVADIPSGLFDFLDTTNGTNFQNMFSYTFDHLAEKSRVANIPSGLFSHLDLSGCTNASSLFESTFAGMIRYPSGRTTNFVIPSGLFNLNFSNCTNFYKCFSYTFGSISVGNPYYVEVPDRLFTIDTSSGTNFDSMFSDTFEQCRTSQSWEPVNLFNLSSTANGTNFQNMFYRTFSQVRMIIPADLFSKVNTSNATNTSQMFYYTFQYTYAYAIPSTLFASISTANATNTSGMFSRTFEDFGHATEVIIPTTLFSNITTPVASNMSNMFMATFGSVYCRVYPEGIFGGLNLAPINGTARNLQNIFGSVFYFDGIYHGMSRVDWVMSDLFLGMTDFSWATADNAASIFRSMFYYSRNSGTDNTVGSASQILQHFNFIPNARTYMFQDRTNLSDYLTIDGNWK